MNRNRPLAKDPLGMWQPDVILPSQYLTPSVAQGPEQRLMIAVLHDAIDCVEKYRFALDFRGRRAFSEAMEWLLVEDSTWPFSFECICGVLDLDATAVRERVCAVATPAVQPETGMMALLKSSTVWPVAPRADAAAQHVRTAPTTLDKEKPCCITPLSSSSSL